jgi:hypothetical protein
MILFCIDFIYFVYSLKLGKYLAEFKVVAWALRMETGGLSIAKNVLLAWRMEE